MTYTQEKKLETVSEEAQTLDLLNKDFKSAILNLFKELKETMTKELKETIRMIFHQIENVNREKLQKKKPNRNSGVENYNN